MLSKLFLIISIFVNKAIQQTCGLPKPKSENDCLPNNKLKCCYLQVKTNLFTTNNCLSLTSAFEANYINNDKSLEINLKCTKNQVIDNSEKITSDIYLIADAIKYPVPFNPGAKYFIKKNTNQEENKEDNKDEMMMNDTMKEEMMKPDDDIKFTFDTKISEVPLHKLESYYNFKYKNHIYEYNSFNNKTTIEKSLASGNFTKKIILPPKEFLKNELILPNLNYNYKILEQIPNTICECGTINKNCCNYKKIDKFNLEKENSKCYVFDSGLINNSNYKYKQFSFESFNYRIEIDCPE